MDRRRFIQCVAATSAVGLTPPLLNRSSAADELADPSAKNDIDDKPFFKTRGVVLRTDDDLATLTTRWPRWAKDAGLTTIGTHISPSSVARFIRSDKGQAFLEACRKHSIQVEHELHAMAEPSADKTTEADDAAQQANEGSARASAHPAPAWVETAVTQKNALRKPQGGWQRASRLTSPFVHRASRRR